MLTILERDQKVIANCLDFKSQGLNHLRKPAQLFVLVNI